jgi:hypothetical protein
MKTFLIFFRINCLNFMQFNKKERHSKQKPRQPAPLIKLNCVGIGHTFTNP